MVPEPLRRLHCKTSRELLPFPIPLYSIYGQTSHNSRKKLQFANPRIKIQENVVSYSWNRHTHALSALPYPSCGYTSRHNNTVAYGRQKPFMRLVHSTADHKQLQTSSDSIKGVMCTQPKGMQQLKLHLLHSFTRAHIGYMCTDSVVPQPSGLSHYYILQYIPCGTHCACVNYYQGSIQKKYVGGGEDILWGEAYGECKARAVG